MKGDLESAPHPKAIQSTVPLESPIQPLNGRPTVVDSLPLWRLDRLGVSLLVAGIRVNDGFSLVLPPNQVAEGIAGVGSIAGNPLESVFRNHTST